MKKSTIKILISKVTKLCVSKPLISGIIGISTIVGGVTLGVLTYNSNSSNSISVEDIANINEELEKNEDIEELNENLDEEEVEIVEQNTEESTNEEVVNPTEVHNAPSNNENIIQSNGTNTNTTNNNSNSQNSNNTSNSTENKPNTPNTSTENKPNTPSTNPPVVNNQPSGISNINEQFKQRYLGIVGCMYNGSKKSQFDSIINQVATGAKSISAAINEINSIGSFQDSDGTTRVVSYADIKTFTTSSNDVDTIIRECNANGTFWGSTYTGVCMYYDAATQKNTVYVLRVTIGQEIINWN